MKSDELTIFRFIENTLFIILGVLVYWLVFSHIIQFKLKGDHEVSNNIFYQKIYT